jgi:hypothetical protein
MHKIFIVCFQTFLHHSIIDRYQTQSSQHFKNILQSHSDILNFQPFPVFPKSRSIDDRYLPKRAVKLSIIFVTVHFQIVLNVFAEKGEGNFAFSATASS